MTPDTAPSENPFSTRRIRPGAVTFLFPEGQSCRGLIERLRRNGWQGEIVGPHGSGKSSLLACFVPELHRAGHETVRVELHDGQRRLPLKLRKLGRLSPSTVMVVDGYEQLGPWGRFRLKFFCRRRRLGLVITSHVPIDFPKLFDTVSNAETAQLLVDRLLEGYERLIDERDVLQAYARQEGNLREMLFDLYDVYESRRRRQSSPA